MNQHSASAFFHQYFRVYSPVTFGKQYDKEGAYIRRYVPELKDMPAKYIYEPWLAPMDVQKKANCVLGVDYPQRICVHEEARQRCMTGMRRAFEARRGAQNDGEGDVADGDAVPDEDATAASSSAKRKKPPAAAASIKKGKQQTELPASTTTTKRRK